MIKKYQFFFCFTTINSIDVDVREKAKELQ